MWTFTYQPATTTEMLLTRKALALDGVARVTAEVATGARTPAVIATELTKVAEIVGALTVTVAADKRVARGDAAKTIALDALDALNPTWGEPFTGRRDDYAQARFAGELAAVKALVQYA